MKILSTKLFLYGLFPFLLELIPRSELTGSEGGHNVKKFNTVFASVPTGYVGHIEIWILLQAAALLAIAVCRWVVSQEMTYRVNILDLE